MPKFPVPIAHGEEPVRNATFKVHLPHDRGHYRSSSWRSSMGQQARGEVHHSCEGILVGLHHRRRLEYTRGQ
jgi:hypothetical protein